ncbi:Cyclin-J18 [Camellia lanceoleosa]|uniref:Cyclin-J18 n=1 Tax=Camellia lanceoleosa TaxID=1840588 RepID=A0ACC0GYP9_9ERIC|nr:Cyclin-J18 [Camellia lanceoleosa]
MAMVSSDLTSSTITMPLPAAPPKPMAVMVDKSLITMEFQRQKAKELQKYFKQKKLDEADQGPFFGFIAKNEISNGRLDRSIAASSLLDSPISRLLSDSDSDQVPYIYIYIHVCISDNRFDIEIVAVGFMHGFVHMHDSHPLSVKCLKSLGDKMIKEQRFTTRDFLEAEVVLMQGIATVGKLVNFEACMDIMDLLYEKDQTSALYNSPKYLAASILACCFICYHSSKTEMGGSQKQH